VSFILFLLMGSGVRVLEIIRAQGDQDMTSVHASSAPPKGPVLVGNA
jgi:hypothetical protein